jgi:MFS family permease
MADEQQPQVSGTPEEKVTYEEPVIFHEERNRWYHKGLKVFGYQLPAYAHADVQLVMVSFVCFLCPGMYNALSGLGGGGQLGQYKSVVDNATVALYSCFAVIGFFSGTVTNRLGAKWTLAIGGIGYGLYSGSLLSFNHNRNGDFVIAAGAILGVCASFLWSAQGVIMMAYATEQTKGRYIATFWAIFNFGGVIGAIIPLAQTINSSNTGSVGDGTYAAFMVLMFLGALLALLLLPSKKVIKADGYNVVVRERPTWFGEFFALFKLLKEEPFIILLFPMFWSSNWFYTYQQNQVNLVRFNIRTRALNSLLYWLAQIVGALTWALILDIKRWQRKSRARVYHAVLFIVALAIWGGGIKFQIVLENTPADFVPLDWTDESFLGPMFLYMFYGAFDAMWQTYVYWLMGALTNSTRKLALYAGFYKGIQSAGAAVIWRLDANLMSGKNEFITCWVLIFASLLIASPVVWTKVDNHTDEEADAMFTVDMHADELHRQQEKIAQHNEFVAEAQA